MESALAKLAGAVKNLTEAEMSDLLHGLVTDVPEAAEYVAAFISSFEPPVV